MLFRDVNRVLFNINNIESVKESSRCLGIKMFTEVNPKSKLLSKHRVLSKLWY